MTLDRDRLRNIGPRVLGRYAYDSVSIDLETYLNPWHPRRRWTDASQVKHPEQFVRARGIVFALQNRDRNHILVILGRRKYLGRHRRNRSILGNNRAKSIASNPN